MKLFVSVCCLLALSSAAPVMSASFGDQKNYYPPDPNQGTPPPAPVYHGSPPYGTSPPHHHPSPSPPVNCASPPPYHVPTPSTPSSPPSGGGGGSYTPPYSGGTPPTPIFVPGTPTTPTTPPYSGGTPPTPIFVPGTPTTPTTPTSPPFVFDPNNPFPGTCNYWRTNPTLIWGLVGWYATMGNAFGGIPSVPGFPSNINLLQALSNTRNDGYGALFREGTASLLNSMAFTRFPFTASQVRNNFMAALGSNKAARSQAEVFRAANEGHYKPRA